MWPWPLHLQRLLLSNTTSLGFTVLLDFPQSVEYKSVSIGYPTQLPVA
jgi:hypothetical protein